MRSTWSCRNPARSMMAQRLHPPYCTLPAALPPAPQIARVLTNEWFYIDMPGATQVNYTDKVPIGNCYSISCSRQAQGWATTFV